MNSTLKAIVLIFLVLYIPQSSNPKADFGITTVFKAFQVINTVYSAYKGIKPFLLREKKFELQDAMKMVVNEIKTLHDQDLISEINGLEFTFNRILDNPNQDNIEEFLGKSDAIRAIISSIIVEQIIFNGEVPYWIVNEISPEIQRGYNLAIPYNILVALTAVVMKEGGYSEGVIKQNLFEPTFKVNGRLLGREYCTYHVAPNSGNHLRSIVYNPLKGIIFNAFRDDNFHNNSSSLLVKILQHSQVFFQQTDQIISAYNKEDIVKILKLSDREIAQEVLHYCSYRPLFSLDFSWQSNYPIYYGNHILAGGSPYIYLLPQEGRGFNCINIYEGQEPRENSWLDNYLCSDIDLGMKWSSGGPIPNMECIQWEESSEPQDTTWHDNFLCFPPHAANFYNFEWSSSGPIDNMECTHISEPREPAITTWHDNYFCYSIRRETS